MPVGQHLPLSQVEPELHCVPQAPQLSGSESGLLHTPLQLLSPVGQHLSLVQVSPVAHESLQLEQWLLVPSVWHVPPQLAWPLAQQMPKSQVPVPQPLPHEPQLLWSSSGLTHTPLQNSSPDAQIDWHVPAWQLVPAPHTLPHEPQLLLSESGLLHVPPQFCVPIVQHRPPLLYVPLVQHMPALHDEPVAQVLPHEPQFALSVSGLLHVPLQFSVPVPQHTP